MGYSVKFSTASAVTVDAASPNWDVLWTFDQLRDVAGYLNAEIENEGAVALSAMELQVQDNPDGEWYTYIGTDDWADETVGNRLFASTGIATLGGTTTGHIQVALNAAHAVRLRAQVASSSTTVSVRGTFSR